MTVELPALVHPARPRRSGRPLHRAVLGYDGSPAARRALDRVAGLADEVTVVTAARVRISGLGIFTDDRFDHDRDRLLDEAGERLRRRGVSALAVGCRGDPAKGIRVTANATGADLVVVGCRGRSRLRSLLSGSTSARVARTCGRDVLIVR